MYNNFALYVYVDTFYMFSLKRILRDLNERDYIILIDFICS